MKDFLSTPLRREEEVGIISEDFTIFIDSSESFDNYNYSDYYENEGFEPQTYGRYRGTYAQDEMGYSDDEIDTIFDGDPSAYWNID